jgi:hypothetical protein
LKIKNVRLAFPVLFKAEGYQGSDPKFSATFILPPNHPQLAEVNEAIATVAKEKWGARAPEIIKQLAATDKLALHKGETKAHLDGFEGNFFINARNKIRPRVMDTNKTVLTAEDGKPYAGCFVVASIALWAQDNATGKRINAELRGVQFLSDGQGFGGGSGTVSDDEFEDLSAGTEAAAELF